MATEDGGFLSRWSRRKAQVRDGREPAEPVPSLPAAPATAAPVTPAAEAPAARSIPAGDEPTPEVDPPPTLEDAATLTPASDFSRFVARDVDPAVRNKALKTLFSDPHFNVMDGLDIYIDDYGKPDPLPAGMLRQMVQSQFLGLFADEKKPAGAANEAPAGTEPQDPSPHEDADLRLQSHDATDAAEPGPGEPGTGEDAAGQR